MLRRIVVLAFAALTASLSFSCSEISRDTAPVEMVATVNQEIQLIDFADAGCGDLGTILLRAITKRTDVSDTRFLDIRLQRLRVSYVRTDGGALIPQPFVQTISGILPVNGTATLNRFFVFEVNALTQAPFAALQPNNGGIDPETGLPFVKMDVILEIFGETLSGENVATTARFPLTFCFNCGGCR